MRLTGKETVEVVTRFAVAAVAVLLVPTTLLGAAFPAAARLAATGARSFTTSSRSSPSPPLRPAS